MSVINTTALKHIVQKIKGRIDNLDYAFEEVSGVADAVDVPSDALPIASLDRIGGMSYKSRNIFNPEKTPQALALSTVEPLENGIRVFTTVKNTTQGYCTRAEYA